jgi:hypothetical protein
MTDTVPKTRPWLIGGSALLILLMLAYLFNHRTPRLFPDLADAASISIVDGRDALELKRGSDDVWRIPSYGDVAADPVKVQDLLTALKAAKRGDPKTDDPSLYETIGLGKGAIRLTLANRTNDVLMDLALGQPDTVDSALRFARIPSDAQTFLVDGLAMVTTNGLAWTNAVPPHLDVSRLTQITLIEPNLQRMELERGSTGHWSRTDVARTNESRAELLATALSGLPPEALRSASSINWFNAHILLADSKDGLQLSLQAKHDGDFVWIRLNAAARQDAAADIQAEAARLNGLRQMAFGVRGDAADALTSRSAQFVLGQN